MNIEEIKNENLKIHWKITIDPKDVESKYNEELTSIFN
jgi:FKBP-type peptidyl-prolyl cis-trans isomerase (trigger factor)